MLKTPDSAPGTYILESFNNRVDILWTSSLANSRTLGTPTTEMQLFRLQRDYDYNPGHNQSGRQTMHSGFIYKEFCASYG